MCLLFGRVRAGREIEMWVILSHRASMWAAYFLLTLWSPFVGLSTQNSEWKRSCPSSSFIGADQLGAPSSVVILHYLPPVFGYVFIVSVQCRTVAAGFARTY
jgi:hypothetical protein